MPQKLIKLNLNQESLHLTHPERKKYTTRIFIGASSGFENELEHNKINTRPVAGQDSSPEIAILLSEAFKNHMSIHAKYESNPSKALPKLTL